MVDQPELSKGFEQPGSPLEIAFLYVTLFRSRLRDSGRVRDGHLGPQFPGPALALALVRMMRKTMKDDEDG
jgi:hypothetical protein